MITFNYEKSKQYYKNLVENKIMCPNHLKLVEELLLNHNISDSATVMDLGSGNGLTSVFLVKEYGLKFFQLICGATQQKTRNFLMKWDFQVMK